MTDTGRRIDRRDVLEEGGEVWHGRKRRRGWGGVLGMPMSAVIAADTQEVGEKSGEGKGNGQGAIRGHTQFRGHDGERSGSHAPSCTPWNRQPSSSSGCKHPQIRGKDSEAATSKTLNL